MSLEKSIHAQITKRGSNTGYEETKIIVKETQLQICQTIEKSIDKDLVDFEKDLTQGIDEWSGATAAVSGINVAFPEGVKFASYNGQSSIFIVEQKPQVRSIYSSEEYNIKNGTNRFRIAFPYLVFGFYFSGKKFVDATICARKTPLRSTQDELCHMCISNIYRSPFGIGICMNQNFEEHLPLDERIANTIREFWQTAFFNSRSHSGLVASSDKVSSFANWERATEQNPNFILEVDWPEIKENGEVVTVEKLITTMQNTVAKNFGNDKNTQVKNKFRPLGIKLVKKVYRHIMEMAAPDRFEPEIENVQVQIAPVAIVPAHIDNPMFRQKLQLKPGQKLCQYCNRVWGARKKLCVCGYDFIAKVHPQKEKENLAKKAVEKLRQLKAVEVEIGPLQAQYLLDQKADLLAQKAEAAKARNFKADLLERAKAMLARAQDARAQVPEKPRLKVKEKIKELVDKVKVKAPPKKVTQGYKKCRNCGLVQGSRTKTCRKCEHMFY